MIVLLTRYSCLLHIYIECRASEANRYRFVLGHGKCVCVCLCMYVCYLVVILLGVTFSALSPCDFHTEFS